MNIVFAANSAYADILATAITSVLENNKKENISFFILTADFSDENKAMLGKLKKRYANFDISYLSPDLSNFSNLPISINYISKETYFRYLIADLLPNKDKALYLDADIIVNKELHSLYQTDISDCHAAAVKDTFIERSGYKSEIGFSDEDLYINAGVILFNLEKLRADKLGEKFIENTMTFGEKIKYQDQDVINITLRGKMKEIDIIYNFATIDAKKNKPKRKDAVIIHYTGRIKPWQKESRHTLKKLWFYYDTIKNSIISQKIRVALLIDEFFGGAGTAFGGYGFLARHYISRYIPNEDIAIDVILGKGKQLFQTQQYCVDNVKLYRLPRKKLFSRLWLKRKNYDLYLSIELTSDWVLKNEPHDNKRLILWIQDPRPMYEWDEINTVKLFPETCYYNQNIYDLVHRLYAEHKIKFISQGLFLNDKAKDLYNLLDDVDISYLPNPVDIDNKFDVQTYQKQNKIVFLGRIESVKRGWLFCEIAKKMPEYEFYILGQSFREKNKNSQIMEKYQNIRNLHFAGHVDGEEKASYLKDAKILVNTSIHEALPISFLEALSYGTLLVSNRNPENLTSKFGIWVGDVLGDGFDKVDLYVEAIRQLICDEKLRKSLSLSARKYIENIHNVENFISRLREIIMQEVALSRD